MTKIDANDLCIGDILLLTDAGLTVEINNGKIKLFMEV